MADSAARIQRTLAHSRMASQLPEALRSYALAVCLEAAPHLEMIPDVFGDYTDHGVYHSCSVLELADKILAQNRLEPWEILIFVLSAFYHDIGMSCPPARWEELEKEPRFRREHRYLRELVLPTARLLDPTEQAVEAQVRVEYLRRHHGELGMRWLAGRFSPERPESWVENLYVWEAVSHVCVGHTLAVQELQGGPYVRRHQIGTLTSVDLKFLACLLRLADICHLSRDRALPHLRLAMTFRSGLSEKIWEAAGDIAGVDLDERRALILVTAQPHSFERHRLIAEFVAGIEDELQNAHRLLSDGEEHQFPWRYVDSSGVRPHPSANYVFEPNARFQLVPEKIIHLLMGSKLYADPLYALRECVQNAVDAIRLFRLKDRSATGRIVVQHSVLPDGSACLDVFDNGTGMDREICLRHLLSVGSRPFASSERAYKHWGVHRGNAQLIAQHGIGFLSCFMLGDTVEVFSAYPGSDRIHLVLDSPTSVGELKATEEHAFPRWSGEVLPESTPWDERHGTCVRIHLGAPIPKRKLMLFLSENILRIGERIVVIYDHEAVELNEVWRETKDHSYRLAEDATLLQMKEALFPDGDEGSDRSFYDGPPRDPSVDGVWETEDSDIRGVVSLKHETNRDSRLSQEGFLVRDGAAGLFGDAREVYDFPFYFDVDVRRGKSFTLDAERARLIDETGALTAELRDWIEERGVRLIGVMESSLFFPCGGPYYHGGADLFTDESRHVSFHDVLRKWYSPERLREVLERGNFEAFLHAKLYATIGRARNEPCSISEMLAGGFSVLVPIDKRKNRYDSTRMGKRQAADMIREVGKVADLEKVIYLPDFPESFSLPLCTVFDFDWVKVSDQAFLGRLAEKKVWNVPRRDVIQEKFGKARVGDKEES